MSLKLRGSPPHCHLTHASNSTLVQGNAVTKQDQIGVVKTGGISRFCSRCLCISCVVVLTTTWHGPPYIDSLGLTRIQRFSRTRGSSRAGSGGVLSITDRVVLGRVG